VQLSLKDFEINVNISLFVHTEIIKIFFLAGFESRDGRRQPSGNSNNRPTDGVRQGGRNGNNYNQQVEDGYEQDGRLFLLI
jgi:hypothetical protein